MRWKGREESENVVDRRGMKPAAMIGGGGLLTIIIVIVVMLLGGDPRQAQQIAQQIDPGPVAQQGAGPGVDDETAQFIKVVLRDTEKVWEQIFEQEFGRPYQPPQLEIFSNVTVTGCGRATAAVGPFYCPADQKVYIDPSFFDQLAKRHQAPGDFAQAYVIAHEIAHHVQLLTGFSQKVDEVRRSGDAVAINRASVRLELQADYLAGVWAHYAQKQYDILEEGDLDEAIQAANQIGDDTLMKEATGYAIPERYTHGTSAQRTKWLIKGLKSGDFEGCRELFELPYEAL